MQPRVGSLGGSDKLNAMLQFRRSAAASLKLSVKVYYCQDESVCLFEEVVFKVPFTAELLAERAVKLLHTVAKRSDNSAR